MTVMGNAHPHEWISTSPFSYGSWRNHGNIIAAVRDAGLEGRWEALKANRHKAFPVIGNDVWIGQEVLLGRGITVGDGAVIGARSLVLHDVEPFTVVVGSPARAKRLRFPERLVQRIQALRWWNYHFTEFRGFRFDQPEAFLDQLEEAIARGLQPYRPEPLRAADLLAAAG
jgi:hypothetical protein